MTARGMRILVCPHSMERGGSQLNALQLAAAVRDRDHEVAVLAEPGPLADVADGYGLELIPLAAGLSRSRPSPTTIAQIRDLVAQRRLGLVHGYEWPPIVEAWAGAGLRDRVPVVGTVMSSGLAPFVPRDIPIAVGIASLRDRVERDGWRNAHLIEPPVDIEHDLAVTDRHPFRVEHGIGDATVLVVVVCRLAPELKREGLLAACDAVGALATAGRPVRLAIVGDGPSRAEIAERARAANQRAGGPAVLLTGELADPRPAYAAADISLGMGGSALRALVYRAPLVVQGELGFFELLTPGSAPRFLKDGWLGLGPGREHGVATLTALLAALVDDPGERARLGAFGRELVERFGLRRTAERQELIYRAAGPPQRGPAVLRDAAVLLRYKVDRKIARRRGRAATDDFNAQDRRSAGAATTGART